MARGSKSKGSGQSASAKRAHRSLARIKPYDEWVREQKRSPKEIEMYWKIVKGFEKIASGEEEASPTITTRVKPKSKRPPSKQ